MKTCKDCQIRYLGCHDRCIDHQENKKIYKQIREKKRENSLYMGYVTDAIDRMRRKRK